MANTTKLLGDDFRPSRWRRPASPRVPCRGAATAAAFSFGPSPARTSPRGLGKHRQARADPRSGDEVLDPDDSPAFYRELFFAISLSSLHV